MYRSSLLVLLVLFSGSALASDLCGFPGRDGNGELAGRVNHWFASADDVLLESGSRQLPLAPGQDLSALSTGSLVLLVQMQGATLNDANSERYGDGLAGDGRGAGWLALQAGQFEWLRVESVTADAVRIRGDGPGGGLRFRYESREPEAADSTGRRRWQLVSVPQYDHARLTGDVTAMPWDGRRGGILAVDVRGTLDLAGHGFDARGTGFRGGAPLNLRGALGGADDWRYMAPLPAELAAGFGQHASKGEGSAGTPRWLWWGGKVVDTRPGVSRSSLSDGYPGGSMGRGAPGNAGGGGNSQTLDNREPGGGGGGGGGRDGLPGQDKSGAPAGGQGGAGLDVDSPRLLMGGGGGAGTRRSGDGEAGAGGVGGGIVVIRTGTLRGPGFVDVSGTDAPEAQAGAGGGGAGGTLMVLAAFESGDELRIRAAGGAGGKAPAAGGNGGAGRVLAGGGVAFAPDGVPVSNHLVPARLPGVAPAYQCRPTGMLLAGMVVEDNGADGAQPHDGRRQRQEQGLAGWPVRLRDRDSEELLDQALSNAAGQFALSLPAHQVERRLALEVTVAEGWWPVLGTAPDLPLAPFAWQGQGVWHFDGRPEYLQDGIVLSVVRLPQLVLPGERTVAPGSTQMFLYQYLPHTHGQVRFSYRGELADAKDWQHAFFLDQDCDGSSEFVDRHQTRWIDYRPGSPVCVRVRVEVPAQARQGSLIMQVDAQSRLEDVPAQLTFPPTQATARIRLAP